MFNIVLIEPDIPNNTGSIGRMCVNLGATLHLIKPLGFDISQKEVRRAGLDYWNKLDLRVWDSKEEFFASLDLQKAHFATTKSDRIYWDVEFNIGDYIIFGSETRGIDEKILKSNIDRCITIPMGKDGRSLNLATSVGVVTYEALRQNFSKLKDFEQIKIDFKD